MLRAERDLMQIDRDRNHGRGVRRDCGIGKRFEAAFALANFSWMQLPGGRLALPFISGALLVRHGHVHPAQVNLSPTN